MPHADGQSSTAKRHPGPTCSHLPSFEATETDLRLPSSSLLSESLLLSWKRGLSSVPSCRLLLCTEKQGNGMRRGYRWLQSHAASQRCPPESVQRHKHRARSSDLGFKLSLRLEALQITPFLPMPSTISCDLPPSLKKFTTSVLLPPLHCLLPTGISSQCPRPSPHSCLWI